MEKSPEAFRTISEVAEFLDTPAHVLRFWESRFPQIKPVKRAGGRRYYRPADVALLGGIRRLLHDEGMTIRGVQKVLRENGVRHVAALASGQDFVDSDFEELLEAAETADFQLAPQGAEVIPLAAFTAEPEAAATSPAGRTEASELLPPSAPIPQPGPVEVVNPGLEDVLPEEMAPEDMDRAADTADHLPEDVCEDPSGTDTDDLPPQRTPEAVVEDLPPAAPEPQVAMAPLPLQPDLFADLSPAPLLVEAVVETVEIEVVLTEDAASEAREPEPEDGPSNLFAAESDEESVIVSASLPESQPEPEPLLDLAPEAPLTVAGSEEVPQVEAPIPASDAEIAAAPGVIWWPAALRALPRDMRYADDLAPVADLARDLLARLQSHR